jgi:glutamyl-tRNA synthetase
MANFLALLGWSHPESREFLTLPELVEAFDLDRVQASPAVFDVARLDNLNGLHLRALGPSVFAARLRPYVPRLPEPLLQTAAPLVQERITRLTEAADLLDFLVEAPAAYPNELVPKKRDAESTAALLRRARELFAAREVGPDLEPELRSLAEQAGWSPRDLFMTLRIALTGRPITPPLLPSAAILGQEECLRRLERAVDWLGAAAPRGGDGA